MAESYTILEQLGMLAKAHSPVKALSGGMQRKLCLGIAFVMYHTSEDSPRGQYSELIAAGKMNKVAVTDSVKKGFGDPITWVMAAQYASEAQRIWVKSRRWIKAPPPKRSKKRKR